MRVPLFGTGIRSRSAAVCAQRRLNCYYDPQPDEDKTRFAIYGTPGLSLILNLGVQKIRGWIVEGLLLYAVYNNVFYEINNAFIATSRGTMLTFSGRVDAASNGQVLVIVDGAYAYTYTIASQTFAQITDADFPANPQTVTWQDGQFIVSFSETGLVGQRVYISSNGTDWDALDFRAAESSPDGLIRVIADHGELHLFGDVTTEFWGYTGDADFPFTPIRGATNEIGLAARWSLAKFDQSLVFLGKNRLGEVQVYRLTGYQAQMISTPDLNAIINDYSVVSDAIGFSYMLDGHPMYQITFQNGGQTWLYDGLSSAAMGMPVWSELTSDGSRHYAELQIQFLGHHYVADYRNGKVYRLDRNVYTDNGIAIERQLDSRHFFKDFERVTVDRLTYDMETGIGLSTGQGSAPQIMHRVSRNGGRTFGNEMLSALGAHGDYTTRVEFRRLGTARDFVFRLRMTDPVKFALTGASIEATPT
jgi:hypothetical protein